jgi:hypothetical protein
VAGRISALKVTWADPKYFKSEHETEDFLRQLLSITNSQTWAFHVWSYLDAVPSVVATVEHMEGKPGKWWVWRSPSLTCAYLDGNGKWWWGAWPKSVPQPFADNLDVIPWGEIVDELQMASTLDGINGVIHCWVRNGGTNEVSYNDFYFGYFEYVKLEIQEATNWITLATSTFPSSGIWSGAGPIAGKIKVLRPREVTTNTWSRRTYPTGRWMEPRHELLANLDRGDTFSVDLFNLQWPSNALYRPYMPARISQSFRIPSTPEGKMVTLYSPVFTLDGTMIPISPDRVNRGQK